MRKVLIFALLLFAGAIAAQPTIWGGAKIKVTQGDTAFTVSAGALKDYIAAYFSGGGTVSSVSVVSANGFAGTVATPTSTPAITLTTSITGMLKGNGTAISAGLAGTDYVIPSGSVATLTTSRNIHGGSFNGSADVTNIIAAQFGGTGNGFTAFTGPTTATKTFTLPDASATILTSNAAVTAAQGGTGQTTYAIGDLLQASASTTLSRLAAVATGNVLISGGVGVVSSWGKVGLTTHVSGILPGANGGTNNGFMDFTGPATTLKTFTLPNSSATILTTAAAVTVAQGGTGLTSIGADVTLLGSNGSANIYYTLGITTTSAAIGFARSGGALNLNIPDADASFRGTVSTGTQSFAGAKTFNSSVTVSGLTTSSAGLAATATASASAVDVIGVPARSYAAVTTNTTIDHTNNMIGIGTLAGNITLTLPPCDATRNKQWYTFTKLGSDAFAFIVDPNGAETFTDNATTKTIYSQNSSFTCQCVSASAKWTVGN